MLTAKLGAKLRNGATIIAITEINESEAIVLALTVGLSGHNYATWAMRLSDNETFQGDYCNTMTDAFESYVERGGK